MRLFEVDMGGDPDNTVELQIKMKGCKGRIDEIQIILSQEVERITGNKRLPCPCREDNERRTT